VHNKLKINNLEKKPQNGGTPAIENKEIIKILLKTFAEWIFVKECKVLKSEFTN
jgi:hypothetical protein